jgi:anaerobic ribonucleoside-triphosphate reductase
MARYGPGQVATEGIRDYPYYTDLFVVPLAAKIDLHQRIALESKFQEQSLGGHLTPIYLAPKEQDPKELLQLTEQACQNHMRFFTYTTNFSYCRRCNKTSLGIASKCPSCGATNLITFGRSSATYTPLTLWAESKRRDIESRTMYSLS